MLAALLLLPLLLHSSAADKDKGHTIIVKSGEHMMPMPVPVPVPVHFPVFTHAAKSFGFHKHFGVSGGGGLLGLASDPASASSGLRRSTVPTFHFVPLDDLEAAFEQRLLRRWMAQRHWHQPVFVPVSVSHGHRHHGNSYAGHRAPFMDVHASGQDPWDPID